MARGGRRPRTGCVSEAAWRGTLRSLPAHEGLVCSLHLFESHLCLRSPRILIWMKSHGKASVGLSDPLFCGIPRDAKDLMRILAEALH